LEGFSPPLCLGPGHRLIKRHSVEPVVVRLMVFLDVSTDILPQIVPLISPESSASIMS
jgi:hypothetical protein